MNEVVVNLKIIGKVGKHQKMITKDAYLNIESASIVPEFLRRWQRGESRNATIQKIEQTVDAAISLHQTDPSIGRYLKEALVGLTNLQETYQPCLQTVARLDAIKDRVLALVNVRGASEDAVRARELASDVELALVGPDAA